MRVVLLAAAAFFDSNFLLLRAASHLAAADSAAPRITRTIVRFVIPRCAAGKKFSQQVYDMGIKVAAVSLLCAAFGCPEPEQFFGL